jgi:hypothetical protein
MIHPLGRAKTWVCTTIVYVFPANIGNIPDSTRLFHLFPQPAREMHGRSMSAPMKKYGANDFLSTPLLFVAPMQIATDINYGVGYGREYESVLVCNNGIGNP